MCHRPSLLSCMNFDPARDTNKIPPDQEQHVTGTVGERVRNNMSLGQSVNESGTACHWDSL